MEYLAKSDGTLLIDHSILTELFALEIYEQMVSDEYKKLKSHDLRKEISVSGLLHDIGKCIEHSQKELGYKKTNKIEDENNDKFILHNQIGWKFLLDYISDPIILKTIYWHHGVYNKIKNSNDITITDSDTNNMINFLNELNLQFSYKKSGIHAEPNFFDNNGVYTKREQNIDDEYLVRICVVSADRIASKYNKYEAIELLKDKEKITKIIKDYLSKK